MRRERSLSAAEKWELGLFLSMMIVGCLCVAVILNLNSLPRLFASFTPTQELAPTRAPSETPIPFPRPTLAFDLNPLPIPQPMTVFNDVLPSELPPEIPQSHIAPKRTLSDIKIFNGQKYRLAKTIKLRVTAYAPDIRCTWPYPGTTTASGLSVKTNHGHLVAADTQLIPLHALVSVPGYNNAVPVPVLDRGGAIKGRRLDLLMPNFDRAKDWGTKTLEVKVYLPL